MQRSVQEVATEVVEDEEERQLRRDLEPCRASARVHRRQPQDWPQYDHQREHAELVEHEAGQRWPEEAVRRRPLLQAVREQAARISRCKPAQRQGERKEGARRRSVATRPETE
jgi:hypothetical protein